MFLCVFRFQICTRDIAHLLTRSKLSQQFFQKGLCKVVFTAVQSLNCRVELQSLKLCALDWIPYCVHVQLENVKRNKGIQRTKNLTLTKSFPYTNGGAKCDCPCRLWRTLRSHPTCRGSPECFVKLSRVKGSQEPKRSTKSNEILWKSSTWKGPTPSLQKRKVQKLCVAWLLLSLASTKKEEFLRGSW